MINTTRLRKIVGWLGMSLAWIVLIQSLLFGFAFPQSISATYFVPTCIVPFMGILISASVLLINYMGYDKTDDILNIIAGLCGICICLFPCAAEQGFIGTFMVPHQISDIIHTVSAVGFFGILAYNSLFQFTKGSANPTENKKKRNIIFRVCGYGMIASFASLVLVSILNSFGILAGLPIIWIVEMIALTFFGISWLTKANCYRWLFAD